jgi:hypothetical protein
LNYTEVVEAIQDFAEYTEADFVANIPRFVSLAEERIQRAVDLPLQRRTQQAPLTAGNKFLSTPSDFLYPFSCSYYDSDGGKHPLLPKQPDWIDEAYGDGASGPPKYYALFDHDSMVFGPTPDDAYLFETTYSALLESISVSSSGTNWISENAANALLYGSMAHAAVFMQSEPDIIQNYERLFTESMGNLMDIADWRTQRDSFRMRNIRPKEVRQ